MDSTTVYIKKITILGLCTFFGVLPINYLKAQELPSTNSAFVNYDSLLADYLLFDSLLINDLLADSAEFFQMLDNLVEGNYITSSFSVRLGYSGQFTNAGRTIGINQAGVNAGVSFYHKTGIFADISAYWNSYQVPNYNSTVVDAGYMGNFTTNWSYWASYSHYFFANSGEDSFTFPFTDAINVANNYTIKKLGIGLDYSLTFGAETAHRIRFNTSYSFSKKNWWVFDRVSLTPNLSLLAGNANVVVWQINTARIDELIQRIGIRRYRFLKKNYPAELESALLYPVENNAFGIMNYSLFVPITFSLKKFSLMINYTINLPVALPNEQLDTSLNNYISSTLMFTF